MLMLLTKNKRELKNYMKYECIVSKKTVDEYEAENYKILKQTFFKSIRRFDVIHSCIKYEGIKY